MYDIEQIRADFPILGRTVYGKPLVYLDNGATTQKPRQVVEAITEEYYNTNANVHRGVHFLSQQATELHEASRETVRRFIGARSTNEVVFTRGTTESINLLASTFCQSQMQAGDEVIVTTMEHHSNIVPWQLQAMQRGIVVRVVPMNDRGELLPGEYEKLFSPKTKIVSLAHVSNVLGTVNPVRELIRTAHAHGVPVLVDGAQSIPHMPVNVQELDAEFYVFSGHKVYGPTGIGVLYGKEEWLDRLPPYQGGGEMILLRYATERLGAIEGMRIFGQAAEKGAVLSFLVGHIHHYDMGMLLDRLGIAVRTGHHCAQPLMQAMGVEGTVRASFSFYNTKEEIDTFAEAVERVRKMF